VPRLRFAPLAFAALLLPLGAAAAPVADVPIWIVDAAPGPAVEAPIRFGLPFPKGTLPRAPALALHVPGAAPAPLQPIPIERWPDGTVRWLIADAVIPATAASRIEARVRSVIGAVAPGLKLHPEPPISIRGTRLTATADPTGAARVKVLGSDDAEIVVTPPVLAAAGAGAARTRHVKLASSGSVRAEIEIEQSIGDALHATTSIVLWNDSSWILVRHRVVNLGLAPSALITAAPLSIRPTGTTQASIMIDGRSARVPIASKRAAFVQPRPDVAMRDDTAIGTHLDGAVAVETRDLSVAVVVPDAWQQYPKAFDVSHEGIVVDLFGGGESPVALGIGAAKSHDVWLRLERRAGATPLPLALAAVSNPPRAVTTPAWVRTSRALPGLIDATQPSVKAFLEHLRSDALRYDSRARYERWDEGAPASCAARTTERPRTGFYGILNWGDWNFPGYRDDAKQCDAWGNLEYDLPFVFGLAFASTGDPIWATRFDRAVTHYRDVDIIHAAPSHPEWVGLNHPHKVGHFDWRSRGSIDLGHVWLEGLLLHARLFGDMRSGDAALALARRLPALETKAGNPRQYGWPMIALAAAAAASGDEALRAAALDYAHAGAGRFRADPSAGDWKLGILASGLAAVHRLTADEQCRDWLRTYGTKLLEPQEKPLDPRYVAVAGYLAALTGDERYDALAKSVAETMPIGTWGKTLAMHGRIGFELLAPLP